MAEKKGLIAEFKEFISRGSVIDLAVGIIVGGAFTAIVNSLVNDMLMPLIGWIFGGIDFTSLKYVITPAAAEAAIYYGNFIQSIVNFLLIAFTIFMLIKGINRFRRKKDAEPEPEPEPEQPAQDVLLLQEIRDLLKEHK